MSVLGQSLCRAAVLLAVALLLAGCATASPHVKWWSPGTWFSAREAVTQDRAATKLDDARARAVKAAQATAHETQQALAAAPESRPVEVARESNDATVTLLDQAAGPLSAAASAQIRAQVAGLLSDNAALRAEAEKNRAANRAAVEKISQQLVSATAALAKAQVDLRHAFDRENALANELRNERLIKWGLAALGLILAAAWCYLKFALGGLPGALGAAMRDLRAAQPQLAASVAPFYAKHLNRHEQERIKRAAG